MGSDERVGVMKKLTPEEKEQRKQDRIRADQEEAADAPRWGMYARANEACSILKPGDACWVQSNQGSDLSVLQLRVN